MRVFGRLPALRTLSFLLLGTLLLSFSIHLWWGERHNSLYDNGRWIIGKDTGKFLFYTYKFMFRPLKESQVLLNRDMAYQEILYHEAEGPRRKLEGLKFEGLVSLNGYLWIELRKVGQRMVGCRLSRKEGYRSGFYRYDDGGELLEYLPFERTPGEELDGWKNIEVVLADRQWHLSVDGLRLGSLPDTGPNNGRFGFRGSGNTRAEVGVRNVEMRFRNPENPARTWTEREDFMPSFSTGSFGVIVFFSLFVLSLRLWRRMLLSALLPEVRRRAFEKSDEAGLVMSLLFLLLLPRATEGFQIPLALFSAEIVCLTAFAVSVRGGRAAVFGLPRRSVLSFALAMVVLSAAAFTMAGENLGRGKPVTWSRMKSVHPDAYILKPDRQSSSSDFVLASPVKVSLGAPYFIEGRAYREQLIAADFVMAREGTFDIVFQQQSYHTRGDPVGEELPFQRRLLRLSTRPDASWGLGKGVRRAPMPFYRIKGTLVSGGDNHIEIISDGDGIQVLLNGEKTLLPGIRPLGFGVTGFMAYEEPVTLTALRIEPTASQAAREGLLPLLGALLPLLPFAAVWLLARPGGGDGLIKASAAGLSSFYPVALYLTAALFLGRENLLFLGDSRLAAFDIFLATAGVSLLYPIILFRSRIRAAALWYNFCLLGVILCLAAFAWDLLPPEHGLKLKFDRDAVVPGELIKQRNKGRSEPWYGYGRLIGVNNYVWRQHLGGRPVTTEKPAGTVRVFTLGGSQAWGSGASSSRETYDALLEKRLRERGLPVEIHNAGVNGAGVGKVHMFYRDVLAGFAPDLLILDVGLNDSASLKSSHSKPKRKRRLKLHLSHFEELLDLCRETGVDVVLVLEPMSREAPLRPYQELYSALERIAGEKGVAVIDAWPVMLELEADHFVWWDTAHLAPYGHQSLAGLLAPVVERLIRERIERTTGEIVEEGERD